MIVKSKIIILGSGPAGYTAAIYSARFNLNPILITGSEIGGQLTSTNLIENWPGDFKKISGSQLMKRMYNHAKKFNTKIIKDHIIKVRLKSFPFELISKENRYLCKSLIIATGSSPKYLEIPSENFYKGKGVSNCAICDGFFYKEKDVAVIGGGNVAFEEALYLSNIARKVYLIHRSQKFRAENILIQKLFKKIKSGIVELKTNNIVSEILGNSSYVTGIKIKNVLNEKKKKYEIINVSGIFISIGYKPNTKIFRDQIELEEKGYIKTKLEKIYGFTKTSIPGIFAAGDVVNHNYKQAITASASGCMAAIDAQKYLEDKN